MTTPAIPAASTATLHDLVIGERGALDEMLEESGGELTPEILQLLDELTLKTEEKLERVAVYYTARIADAKRNEELATRYIARAGALRKGAEGMKGYAEQLMRIGGFQKVKRALATLWIQSNPPSVKGELDEMALRELAQIEPTLVRHKPETFELDRRAALTYHDAGHALPDGLTVEQSSSLRIKS